MHNVDIRKMNADNKLAVRYSPDFPWLVDQGEHLVFVVDGLQHGCEHHHFLGNSEYGCRAYTEAGFECYRHPLTDTVIPLYGAREPELIDKLYFARIKGEVHVVPTKRIPKLDTWMLNTVQFKRIRINVLAPERDHFYIDNGVLDYVTGLDLPYTLQGFKHWRGPERIVKLRVWMYVAVRDYWTPVIDGLSFDRLEMRDSHREWVQRHYQYNKRRNE